MTAVAARPPRRSIATFGALPAAAQAFVLGVGAGALAAIMAAVAHLPPDEPWAMFALLATGAALVNLRGVTTGRHHRLDGAILFITAGALLLPPELVAFMGLAQHGVDGMRRRYPWFAQVFNISNSTLAGLTAWSVSHAIAGGAGADDPRLALAAAAGGVTVVVT